MAYTSVIPVRRLDRAVKYVMNKEKTTAVSLQDALDYAANRDKTEQSCWEGIDFPSDMVSLLIIAKLPFPIPDPVSDYERRQYPNLRDYINAEIIPEMQKKLRQGFGRAIRTEQDSCVVAILDERAGIGGKYHDAALAALPTCPTTEKIEDVQQFIREQKRPDYFL